MKNFTTEQKIEAGMTYYQYQNYVETARILTEQWGREVSKQVVKYWDDNSDQFAEGKRKGANLIDKKLSAKMLKGLNMGIDYINEQLETNKEKLKFSDVVNMVKNLQDKRQVLEGKATSISGAPKELDDRLKRLEKNLVDSNDERGIERKFSVVK